MRRGGIPTGPAVVGGAILVVVIAGMLLRRNPPIDQAPADPNYHRRPPDQISLVTVGYDTKHIDPYASYRAEPKDGRVDFVPGRWDGFSGSAAGDQSLYLAAPGSPPLGPDAVSPPLDDPIGRLGATLGLSGSSERRQASIQGRYSFQVMGRPDERGKSPEDKLTVIFHRLGTVRKGFGAARIERNGRVLLSTSDHQPKVDGNPTGIGDIAVPVRMIPTAGGRSLGGASVKSDTLIAAGGAPSSAVEQIEVWDIEPGWPSGKPESKELSAGESANETKVIDEQQRADVSDQRNRTAMWFELQTQHGIGSGLSVEVLDARDEPIRSDLRWVGKNAYVLIRRGYREDQRTVRARLHWTSNTRIITLPKLPPVH